MSEVSEEIHVSLDTAKELGLLPEEFEKIISILGRTPNFTELSIYSVMWSEHCSYKNSIRWLKTLPREGKHLLAKAGEENAGLVDIGDGLACAFKIESHNHPRSEEHTSELQSLTNLVCRLLLEKKTIVGRTDSSRHL